MKIVMEFIGEFDGDELTPEEVAHIQFLLSDALHDFRTGARSAPREYVESRYPWMSDVQKEQKALQVERRTKLAARLQNTVLRAVVER